MKVLIIEDEHHAQKRLLKLIQSLRPNVKAMGVFDSVEDTVEWLRENEEPDLLFMDIQLSDGLSFEIFSEVSIQAPVIFTTAFDQYAIKAFKVNSVDYLLKPIEEEELEKAIAKFESQQEQSTSTSYDPEKISDLLASLTKREYQKRFLIKTGQQMTYVQTEDIAYLYSENSLSFIQTLDNRKYSIDYTIDQLNDLLDPNLFFRINRKAIIRINALKKALPYFNNRLVLKVSPPAPFDLIISREKVRRFKQWMGGA
ncbi:MAG: LytTR family DNA-binding domain-containing protein [Bacteroidota bacterium]